MVSLRLNICDDIYAGDDSPSPNLSTTTPCFSINNLLFSVSANLFYFNQIADRNKNDICIAGEVGRPVLFCPSVARTFR